MTIFQSDRSIPSPVDTTLPCVTLPIIARSYSEAVTMEGSLRRVFFKGHFNHSALRWIDKNLFIASFGRYGEHNLQWEIEKYMDAMKTNKSSEGEALCTTS